MAERRRKCSLEMKKAREPGSDAILATSCPLLFTAGTGAELGSGCAGNDKSQQQRPGGQQLIGFDAAPVHGADAGWQSPACPGSPTNNNVSSTVRIFSPSRVMG
ncbi:MAG TPA: hypothetical protein VL486_08515 [Verrucomicrobiae bacterium]|nr:hypothetical protein [Verrucomicrobiae bacterium]